MAKGTVVLVTHYTVVVKDHHETKKYRQVILSRDNLCALYVIENVSASVFRQQFYLCL